MATMITNIGSLISPCTRILSRRRYIHGSLQWKRFARGGGGRRPTPPSFEDEDVKYDSNRGSRLKIPRQDETMREIDQILEKSKVLKAEEEAEHDPLLGHWNTSIIPKLEEPPPKVFKRTEPKIDPRHTSIILFPGQGAQFVGMGAEAIEAETVQMMYRVAGDVLGYNLLNLCLKGPQEELDRTIHQQPALFVTSLAAVEKLRVERPGMVEKCVATAGFSVGEFAALVFARSIKFEDALRLVKIRAEAMQLASELAPQGMMTIFYGADGRPEFACKAASEWCLRKGIDQEFAVCRVANYLFPHCKVVAGHEDALEFIKINAKDFGIKRCKPLPVSGAFHTPLMEPAKEVFREAIKKIPIEKPLIRVHSNVDGKSYMNATEVRKKLVQQIVKPVRWEQILHKIYDRDKDSPHFPWTFECGPGKGLITMLGYVNATARKQAAHIPA